jgi:hypothetical protein
MAHPIRTIDQDLRLAQILLGPIHPEPQGVTLMINPP